MQKHVLRLAESRAGEGKATTKEALSSEVGEVNVDSRENHSGRESDDSDKTGGFGGASCPQGGGGTPHDLRKGGGQKWEAEVWILFPPPP